MTDSTDRIQALEEALDAHARALASVDPVDLEQANSRLAAVLADWRRTAGRGALPIPVRDRLRDRLAAQAALVARASSGARGALTALGLAADPLGPAPAGAQPRRRATHLTA